MGGVGSGDGNPNSRDMPCSKEQQAHHDAQDAEHIGRKPSEHPGEAAGRFDGGGNWNFGDGFIHGDLTSSPPLSHDVTRRAALRTSQNPE